MAWRPAYPGEVPTLGFTVIDWMTAYLAAPDRSSYEPFVPTREQAQFILNLYALNHRAKDGMGHNVARRQYRRAVLSRPKGWGKAHCWRPWRVPRR